jgi:hypothetical protein
MPVGVKNSYVSKGRVVNKVVWQAKHMKYMWGLYNNEFITYMCRWFFMDQMGSRTVSLVFCITCRMCVQQVMTQDPSYNIYSDLSCV